MKLLEILTKNATAAKKYIDKAIATYAPTKDGKGATGTWGIDISGNAKTADAFSKSGNELGMLLWNMLHRYGDNYVPSDTSNQGWNNLGFCIIWYEEFKINKQPTQYGQLINIPARQYDESTQIWIEQPGGIIWTRAGNHNEGINNKAFVQRG